MKNLLFYLTGFKVEFHYLRSKVNENNMYVYIPNVDPVKTRKIKKIVADEELEISISNGLHIQEKRVDL